MKSLQFHMRVVPSVGLIVLASACTDPSLAQCDAIRNQYIVRDGRGILQETAELLPSLNIEQQFQIYHCAARTSRPSLTDLAPAIAAQPAAGMFLVEAVRDAPDDATVLSAVELLAEMKRQGTFHAERDSEAMAILSRRVLGIRSGAQRRSAQSRLSYLLDERSDDSPAHVPGQ
jgi:hypothetical protein